MKKLPVIPAVALLLLFSLAACQEARQEKNFDYQGSSTGSASSMVEQFKAAPADI